MNDTIKENEFLTREVLDAVLWVNTLFRGKVIFGGSFGLAAHGLLARKISDIDCITLENWYGAFYEHIGQYGIASSNSESFEVDGVLVLCFKITAPNGVVVDVMFRKDVDTGVKYVKRYISTRREYDGEIKVQKIGQIIEAKANWIKKHVIWRAPRPAWTSQASAMKHQDDIESINAVLERRRKNATDLAIRNIEDGLGDEDIDFDDEEESGDSNFI